jgi:hypothetical protein
MSERDWRFQYATTVAVGVDLGQSQDPTSIAVVERIGPSMRDGCEAWRQPEVRAALREPQHRPRYNLRLLEQAPLGEAYPLQAHRVNRLLARDAIAKWEPRVYVDYTGVGRAVFDIFKQERVPRIHAVTIGFGGQETRNGAGIYVPKLALVSRLQALMHTGCLHMPDTLPLAKVFRRELLDFRVSYTPTGNATFGAREGAHDDLILAVALAVLGLGAPQAEVSPLPMF